MATPPSLPIGWQWEFNDTTQRWSFWHPTSGHKQAHFPKAGDEIAFANLNVKQPIEYLLTKSIEGKTTASMAAVHELPETVLPQNAMAAVTASVASIAIDVRPVPSPTSTGIVKRKPILCSGNLAPQSAPTLSQVPSVSCVAEQEAAGGQNFQNEEEAPPALPARPSASPAATQDTPDDEVNPPLPPRPLASATSPSHIRQPRSHAPTASPPRPPPPISAQTASNISTNPYSGNLPSSQTQNSASLPGIRHISMPLNSYPLALDQRHPSLPMLQPVQTAPISTSSQQPQRPHMISVASAPQVLQTSQTAGVQESILNQEAMQKNSKMRRMSKGVGNWVKKHPKMAVGGAVLIEAAGLAVGVDAIKDAASVQRNVQSYKAKQNSQQQKAAAQENSESTSKQNLSQQGVQQRTTNMSQNSAQQLKPNGNLHQTQLAMHNINHAIRNMNEAQQQAYQQQLTYQQQLAYQQQLIAQQQVYQAQYSSQYNAAQPVYNAQSFLQPTVSYDPQLQQPIYIDNSANVGGNDGLVDTLLLAVS